MFIVYQLFAVYILTVLVVVLYIARPTRGELIALRWVVVIAGNPRPLFVLTRSINAEAFAVVTAADVAICSDPFVSIRNFSSPPI